MNGCETMRSRNDMQAKRYDFPALAKEPLWSGKLCLDHPGFTGREMPQDRLCKNCWRLLMGFPTRMYTDRFPEHGASRAA